MSAANPFFTILSEPASSASSLPPGFNAWIAWLLSQCCLATYAQYDSGGPVDLSHLTLGSGCTLSVGNAVALTVSEPNGPGSSSGDPGSYVTIPVGFIAPISVAGSAHGVPAQLTVVALRGSQSWDEWLDDAESLPASFASGAYGNAYAHGGIYGLYVTGTDGAYPSGSSLDPILANRSPGSVAYQVMQYFQSNPQSGRTVLVTGHSLGGGMAPLCAWDIASIIDPKSDPQMYSFAAPRCVMAGSINLISDFPVIFTVGDFVAPYQEAVPNSFRIVNACDLVPVLPPSTIFNNGTFELQAAHVTDEGMEQNVITFCSQAGDAGANHSCLSVYVPYAKWLATQTLPPPWPPTVTKVSDAPKARRAVSRKARVRF